MKTSWQGRRLLVVVAHPDDETFGCGSVIADAAAGGASVSVCCATRGEAGEPAPGADLGGLSLGQVRVRELHEAGATLGVQEFILLDFVDSGMQGAPPADSLAGAALEDVIDAVGHVLRRVQPDAVVTLDPRGGDGHRDHARIGEATTEAVRTWSAGASLYYWCLSRDLLDRWRRGLSRSNPHSDHLDSDPSSLGRSEEELTTVVDVSPHLELRRRAIALHASQRSPYEDMPDDLADAFLRHDRFIRAEPPWTGGPIETALPVWARVSRGLMVVRPR